MFSTRVVVLSRRQMQRWVDKRCRWCHLGWLQQPLISTESYWSMMWHHLTQLQSTSINSDNSTVTDAESVSWYSMSHTALFPGPPGWAGARRELLDFMVQGKINTGRHTDHLAGRHSIRTNQCPPPPSPHIFYRPAALPAAQPTASKHWRQLAHLD